MIGRGAQGQPWVVGQIAAGLAGQVAIATPSGTELIGVVVEHYEGVLSEYGVEVGVRAARKHLDWYLEAANLAIDKSLRQLMIESKNPREVIGLVDSIFSAGMQEAA
jgi:tRNA-dihydrouridine synthase B